MKIFIITMDDPLYTIPFIREIINARKESIIGLAVTKGDRMTIGHNKSKLLYLISLFLIMGLPYFISNSYTTLKFKLKKKLSKYNFIKSPSILSYAEEEGIKTYKIKTPNSKSFLMSLERSKPDLIISQSQSILKGPLLSIPSIGTLNRHNALLPKNRGRLTPFWVLYNQEKETGVSIHFVNERIDSGPIVLQEKYNVSKKDTFKTLVNKNYEIAPKLMLQAINLLEEGFTDFIENDDNKATTNSTPSLKEAWVYRKRIILRRCKKE